MSLVLLVLLSLSPAVFGANILGVFPVTSISHQIVYRRLMLELNKRGHNVTVITPDPVKNPNLRNYREIDVSFFYDVYNKMVVISPKQLKRTEKFPELFVFSFLPMTNLMCHKYLSSPQVQALIKENPSFDLVILEFSVSPCFYGFAKFSGYKHMGIFSLQTTSATLSNLGNPVDPSYLPEVLLPYSGKLTFCQKLRIIIFQTVTRIVSFYLGINNDAIAKQYFGEDLPHIGDIGRNVSALMVNTHFTIGAPRPYGPNVIEIGGPPFHIIGRKPKPLPKQKLNQSTVFRGTEMIWVPILLLLTWTSSVSNGAKILVIVPTASYSHQLFYRVYLEELHRRGHEVTVATTDPLRDLNSSRYKEIDLSYTYKSFKKIVDGGEIKFNLPFYEGLFFMFGKLVVDTCHKVLSNPDVIDLYRRNEKFDLFVMEWGIYGCLLPFRKLADGKMIGISSFELGAAVQNDLGGAWSAAFAPETVLEYSDRMNFFQRLRSFIYYWNFRIYIMLLRRIEMNIARQYFGPDIESISEMERNVSLIMDNSHVTMSYPRPSSPILIPLGGPAFHLNGRRPKPLPKDIKDFLDDAPHGVIYFSLGTNVKTSNMSSKEEVVLMESFARIKQKVLWRWENEDLKINSKNVMKRRWLPQVDVLAHPNVKAFVTQAGLQSISEAIEHQVPMIVMPFFADQPHNARKLVLEGVALHFDYEELNVEDFTRALNEIVYNETYKKNIKRLSALVKDQPIPPLERAVWWTEYIIRHNGAPHLRSAAATMPWYQYYLIDVLAFLFFSLLLILGIMYITVRALLRLVFASKKAKKE